MTIEANEILMRRFLVDVWSQGNLATADEILAPDFEFILSFEQREGIEAFDALLLRNRTVYENLTYHVNDLVASEEKGAAYWTMSGKHVGFWNQIEGTNKEVSINGITFFTFANGKIATARVQNDVLGLLNQLGGIVRSSSRGDNPYRLEYLFSFKPYLSDVELIGPAAPGLRANVHVTGGEVWGPKLQGKLRSGGSNTTLLRTDGIFEVDYRIVIETTAGTLIDCECIGLADFGADAYQKFFEDTGTRGQGGSLPPTRYQRAGVTFHTADPNYAWLNRVFGIGLGQFEAKTIEGTYDIYAIRQPDQDG